MSSEPRAARAIIFSRLAFANTSLILKCFTRELGRITLIAKGASRPKSPFLGQIDLFYLVDLVYLPSRSSEMHTLKEIKLVEPHLGLRKSYVNLLTAHYFATLVETITEADTPVAQEVELFHKALTYLCENESSWRAVHRFEQRILTLAGIEQNEADFVQAFQSLHLKIPPQREDLRKLLAVEKWSL